MTTAVVLKEEGRYFLNGCFALLSLLPACLIHLLDTRKRVYQHVQLPYCLQMVQQELQLQVHFSHGQVQQGLLESLGTMFILEQIPWQ